MTMSLNISISDNFDFTCIPISVSVDSSLPAGFSIFSLFMDDRTSSTVIFLDDILSGSNQILIAYFLSPPTVTEATPGKIDNLSIIFLSR